MEDRDTAKITARPLSLVFLEVGIEGREKGANKRDLEHRSCERTLTALVHDCKRN